MKELKTVKIQVCMSEAEAQKFKLAAEREGLKLGTWVRRCACFHCLGQDPFEERLERLIESRKHE
jgi:hypothetical protein